MLLSMTGFGEAAHQQDGLAVAVEIRSINSRYLKLSLRCTEGYGALEPRIEATVRKSIRRGTVQVNLRIDQTKSPDDYRINLDVLSGYRSQLKQWLQSESVADPRLAEDTVPSWALLGLPGAVEEASSTSADLDEQWPLIEQTLHSALEKLSAMRQDEGRAMAEDLAENCRYALEHLGKISRRAPLVVEDYRQRLTERLNRTLAEFEVAVEPAELVREVGLFAERGDISEEIVRLRSHVEQFQQTIEAEDLAGRKLEFLTQEMFRETNTIGSKANDVEIAKHVIEIKSAIERLREMVQNIE